MARVVLIHWKPAEAATPAELLRSFGHEVTVLAPDGAAGLRPLRTDPPEAFVIDLGRIPSQGSAVAIELRRQRGTRAVPLVFAGGEAEKVRRIRALLPDAVFTDWAGMEGALAAALAAAPAAPVVPGTMAGYSGTPLVRKLGIRAGSAVALLGAPPGFERTLEPLPEGVKLRRNTRVAADLMLLFVDSQAGLRKHFAPTIRKLNPRGGIWIAWPKKASGVASNLTEREVRGFGLGEGFVDYKVCAIDEKWSGLLFVRRRTSPAGRSWGA